MATAVTPLSTSSLNPDAALFIPSSAHLAVMNRAFTEDIVEMLIPEWDVEDFSPEWWNLVQTSPDFREFWLQGYEAIDAEDLLSFIQLEDFKEASVDLEK